MLTLLAVLALSGCHDKATDSASTDAIPFAWPDRGLDPWTELAAIPPDPLRLLIHMQLEGTVSPARLMPIGARALTGVLDPGDGAIEVLDARYHQTRSPVCLDLSFFDGFEVGDRQGSCDSGEVALNRGRLAPPGGLIAGAADEAGLAFYAINREGQLFRAEADVLAGDPFDFLRLGDGVALEDPGVIPEGSQARVADGRIWLAHGLLLSAWTPDGALSERRALPGTASDMAWVDGGMWVVTDGGLVSGDGQVFPVAGARIAAMGDAAWVTLPGDEQVAVFEGGAQRTLDVAGLLDGVAADADTGKLYLATRDGLAVLRGDEVIARYPAEPPVDLAVAGGHEILALGPEGGVTVYMDEEALVGPEPLDILLTTFFEKPRSPDEDLGCRSEDGSADAQSVRDNVARAMGNMPLIQDLPTPASLAVIPWAARRVVECGEEVSFQPVWDNDFVEHGALFHQEYTECEGDPDCQEAGMATDLGLLESLGLELTWTTGLTPQLDLGLDWARALVDLAAPPRFLFFGMSILPEIPHRTDPRAKDAYPFVAADRSAAWRIETATDPVPGDPEGPIWLYPGDSVAAFTEGGCPNLLIQECRLVGGGGGQRLDTDDVEVLQLLLYRALAARRDGRVDTWSFHLPDLGAFDYTADCQETDRIWTATGEAICQAQVLQEWMFDVHQRFVLNGLARWAVPSQLGTP